MSRKTVTVEYVGGFHNYASATFRFKKLDWETHPFFSYCASPSQKAKAKRIFCGFSDCICGDIDRAQGQEV